MSKQILHNRPCLDGEEEMAVRKVLQSHWLIAGKVVDKLEDNIQRHAKVKYAVAVNSGLSALHLALIALGVGKNDQVILPSYTCVALLHAVNYVGATPVLVDIENNGFNIDPSQVQKKLTKKTKAIIVPHTLGFPAEVELIKKLDVAVIEDCAIAIGGKLRGKPLGSFGDISIFSFYATKMITSGQGGMVVTNNRKFFITLDDLVRPSQRKDYRVRYNYQMTDIAASMANIQFQKLPQFLERRRVIGSRYQKILDSKSSVSYYPKRRDQESNYYRFIVKFTDQKVRDNVKGEFVKKGIKAIVPIENWELLHNLLKFPKKDFPNSEGRSHTTLSLPIYPCLSDREVEIVCRSLDQIIT